MMQPRSTSKFLRAAVELRREIVSSVTHPGERVVTREKIEKRFGLSRVTAQKVLTRLQQEGFVESHGRRGSFVVQHPPHLSRYAVLFRSHPGEESWYSFEDLLLQQCRLRHDPPARQVLPFFDIDMHHADAPDAQQLLEDLAHDRLAGLLLTRSHELPEWLLSSGLRLPPCVGIAHRETRSESISVVELRVRDWMTMVLETLAARHRYSAAFLNPPMDSSRVLQEYRDELNRLGITTRAAWIQAVEPRYARWARNAVIGMFDRPAAHRPEALVVCDDNLLTSSLLGLKDLGLAVPDDVPVVSHANFPAPPPAGVDVIRVGYDMGEALRTMLECAQSISWEGGRPRSIKLSPLVASPEHALPA